MTMRKTAMLLLSAALIAGLSAACAGQKQGAAPGGAVTSPAPAPTAGTAAGGPTAANAEEIYKQNCISCHGANQEGKLGPNTNIQKVGGKLSKEQISNKILNGGGGMVAFKGKLKDNEVAALADWLAAKK